MERTERERLLRRLVEWGPANGILSVYVHVDPGDRSRAWRIELRERLRALAEQFSTHAERRAFDAAAGEVLERFPEHGPPAEGRGHAGFVELTEQRPTAVWRSMQMAPRRTEVVHAQRPYVRPLIELFNEGPHVGVVIGSAERVRLLDWSLGAIRQLQDREITLWSGDWRERKAERSLPGPQGHTSASASGHDQFDQRLDANRRRFLREVGSEIAKERVTRRWEQLIGFGAEDHCRELAEGLGAESRDLHVVGHDLISAREGQIAERVLAEVRALNADRAQALVAEIDEAVGAVPGAALGPQETLQALAEGRARHLVFDADRAYGGPPLEAELPFDDGTADGVPVAERLVELAVTTDAAITPVYEEPASKLEAHGGVAALLRY